MNRYYKDKIKYLEEQIAKKNSEIDRLLALLNLNNKKEANGGVDPLTNLPGRDRAALLINQAIVNSKETGGYVGVLFLNLDKFRLINELLGYRFGDLLLKEITLFLLDDIATKDALFKHGADEFFIILNKLNKQSDAAKVAGKILRRFASGFKIDGKNWHIKASIGIALYPKSGVNADELLKNAAKAMYAAKKENQCKYKFFNAKLNKEREKYIAMLLGLATVAYDNELCLQYQPILDLKTQKCVGIEALVRWQNPKFGMLFPEEFLPCAEEDGEIHSIGRWVWRHAIADYKKLIIEPGFFICINMSLSEIAMKNVRYFILSCLQKNGVSPLSVVIELTENMIMLSPKSSVAKIKSLSDAGVRIAMDDFGMGYSSLSMLNKVHVDILKIDKSFVFGINKNINDEIIIKSTVKLAHTLGMKVIAEGVETLEQYNFLKDHDCDYAQGYYFSRPIDFDRLVKYLL